MHIACIESVLYMIRCKISFSLYRELVFEELMFTQKLNTVKYRKNYNIYICSIKNDSMFLSLVYCTSFLYK